LAEAGVNVWRFRADGGGAFDQVDRRRQIALLHRENSEAMQGIGIFRISGQKISVEVFGLG
jgi:hypothetical protein